MAIQLDQQHEGALGLLWIDLETTGTDQVKDEIIEIGALLTDFNFDLQGRPQEIEFAAIIEPTDYALGRLMKDPIVREMHMQNGLLDACLGSPDRHAGIREAEDALLRWLNSTINSRKTRGPVTKFKFMLAGSGVGHFDRRFIAEHMKRLDRLLVYAPLDVGMVRRFLKMSGVEPSAGTLFSQTNHRALDDIIQHLDEARTFRDMFKQLSKLEEASNA